MSELLIHNARIITPQQTLIDAWLLSRHGIIDDIGTGQLPDIAHAIDAHGHTLLAGFIDVHVHGAVGADVMDADLDSLEQMAVYFAQHGVTSFLPTTLTASHADLLAALQTVATAMESNLRGATILGAHLEGPYLNPEKCGAQDIGFIRQAERDEALELLDIGVIQLASIAPEYEKNLWLIDECRRRGITVSAAHTNATYIEMLNGIAHGITQATHTYNAMPSLHHREPGGLAALLLAEQVRTELIADNIHVHPAMMQLLYRLKGATGVILISDAMRAAGMSDGVYKLGQHAVRVQDGKAIIADGTLAGSILTMDVALKNFVEATGATLDEIWQVSSLNAANALNIADRKGSLEIGKDADLVLLNEQFEVQLTVIGGEIAYQA